MFNVDLTIELNTDYYEPIDNNFVFKVNNESFYINSPILFDENYNILELGTTHSLKQNMNTHRSTEDEMVAVDDVISHEKFIILFL